MHLVLSAKVCLEQYTAVYLVTAYRHLHHLFLCTMQTAKAQHVYRCHYAFYQLFPYNNPVFTSFSIELHACYQLIQRTIALSDLVAL